MRDYVLYSKVLKFSFIGYLLCVSTSIFADRYAYSPKPNYVGQEASNSYYSEVDNPWFQSDSQDSGAGIWSLSAVPQYERQNDFPAQPRYQYQAPYQVNNQRQYNNIPQQRYVTPEIIESLNRQEAQYYYQLQRKRQDDTRRRNNSLAQNRLPPRYQSQRQDYPGYGMQDLDRGYDVPAVSPWGSAPDGLYRGENFSSLPNQAVGGMPPMTMPMFGNDNGFPENGAASYKRDNGIFNPYTFLQNGN